MPLPATSSPAPVSTPEAQVLLVEDELRVRDGVQRELERRGYDILNARTAADAIRVLSLKRPDAIILDLGLPDADGGALLRVLRKKGLDIPVLIYTGRTLQRSVSEAFEEVDAKVITKTASLEPLCASLESALGGRWTRDLSDPTQEDAPGFAEALRRRLARSSIEEADFPILDVRVAKLQKIVSNDDAPITPILDMVENDPRLVSAVLTEANSAFYGSAKRVTNIRRACIQLGARRVAALTTQVLVSGAFRTTREPFASLSQGLWIESVVCARLASRLAEELPGINADEVYTVALLHNIGELLIVDLASKLPHDVGDSEAEALFAELETNHERIGRMLMERWELPRLLQELAGNHHAEDPPGTPLTDRAELRQLVVGAWELAAQVTPSRLSFDGDPAALLEPLGVSPDVLARLQEEAESWPSALRRS